MMDRKSVVKIERRKLRVQNTLKLVLLSRESPSNFALGFTTTYNNNL